MTDGLQKWGRAVRRIWMRGLAVLFQESWVLDDVDLTDFNTGDTDDPDRPRKVPLRVGCSVRERAGFATVAFAQTDDCLRIFIKAYLADPSLDGACQIVNVRQVLIKK